MGGAGTSRSNVNRGGEGDASTVSGVTSIGGVEMANRRPSQATRLQG